MVAMRAVKAAAAVLAMLGGRAASADPNDPPAKVSLATEPDGSAWQSSGFRLGLSVEGGGLAGIRGAPSGRLFGVELHAGLRLDEDWSIDTTFAYGLAKSSGGLDGVRFAGTVDPTWHVTHTWSIAIGFGFGGIIEGNTGRSDPAPLPSTLDNSYTFPNARRPIASCSGVGVAGLVRGAWTHVLGPRASTNVSLELIGQYTACSDGTGTNDPDTGAEIVRRQYWPHAGAALSWGVVWR
jgi:hypothetical protein